MHYSPFSPRSIVTFLFFQCINQLWHPRLEQMVLLTCLKWTKTPHTVLESTGQSIFPDALMFTNQHRNTAVFLQKYSMPALPTLVHSLCSKSSISCGKAVSADPGLKHNEPLTLLPWLLTKRTFSLYVSWRQMYPESHTF